MQHFRINAFFLLSGKWIGEQQNSGVGMLDSVFVGSNDLVQLTGLEFFRIDEYAPSLADRNFNILSIIKSIC